MFDWAVLSTYGTLARKLQSVGVSVPSVKSLIASLQSVLDQDRVDFNTVASSIYDEACAAVGMKELSVPRVVGIQVHRDNVDRLSDLCGLHCHHERVDKTNRILATMAGEKRRRIDF